MSWTVVEFVDSNTVEAVPTSWLQNNDCYWPPLTRTKIINEIRRNASPDTCWPLYKIRVFKDGTFDDYLTARKKAHKAEETSDLNSEAESQKRKIMKRKAFSSSDSSDCEESRLPLPPKIRLQNRNIPSNSSVTEDISFNISGDETSLTCQPKSNSKQSVNFPSTSLRVNEPPIYTVREREAPVYHATPRSVKMYSEQTDNKSSNEPGHCCCHTINKKLDDIYKDLTKKISYLKANLYQVREDIQLFISSHNTHEEPVDNFLRKFDFPFSNQNQLVELEAYLEEESNFKGAVAELKKIGGKDVYELIKRCFNTTILDCLAKTYSYDGTKEKRPFKDLKVNLLFTAAAESKGDKKDVEIAIRKWLRRAAERDKHRSK